MMLRHAYDVLLTDIVMPGEEDGIGLARWARQRYPAMRIILMSGYSPEEAPVLLKLPFLQKPYRQETILDMVEGETTPARPEADGATLN